MSAPTYFGSAATPADNAAQGEPATVAVTPPASMVSGDLVVFIALLGLSAPGGTAPAISATGGQTWNGPSNITGANNADFSVFWCQYNGTWSADPSIIFAAESGTIPVSAIMHVFRPSVVGTWTEDTAIAGGAEASASPVVITGITPNRNDNVTLAGWAIRATAITWGTIAGAGWVVTGTAQYRNTTGTDITASFAHQLQGVKAATGDVSKIPSTAGAGISFTMAWYNNLTPPTIALNTADASSFSTSTPTVESTATDGNAEDVRYNLQISAQSSFVDLRTSLISAWELEAASGTRVDAVVASGNDLADINTVTQQTGKVGSCAQFTAANVEYLSKASNALLQAGDIDFTFAAWVWIDAKPANAMTIVAKDDNVSPGQREYLLDWESGNDRFNFTVFVATDSAKTATANFLGSPATGTWYLVIGWHDATANTVNIQVSDGTLNSVATGGALQAASNAEFRIGYNPIASGLNPWDGRIDQVFFWKRVLTAQERTDLYNAGSGRTYAAITPSAFLDKVSGTDSGFSNTVSGGDTDPFNSGQKVSFTVQAGDALADGTYFWRARASDPNGGNTNSAWATARSFTIASNPFTAWSEMPRPMDNERYQVITY